MCKCTNAITLVIEMMFNLKSDAAQRLNVITDILNIILPKGSQPYIFATAKNLYTGHLVILFDMTIPFGTDCKSFFCLKKLYNLTPHSKVLPPELTSSPSANLNKTLPV